MVSTGASSCDLWPGIGTVQIVLCLRRAASDCDVLPGGPVVVSGPAHGWPWIRSCVGFRGCYLDMWEVVR